MKRTKFFLFIVHIGQEQDLLQIDSDTLYVYLQKVLAQELFLVKLIEYGRSWGYVNFHCCIRNEHSSCDNLEPKIIYFRAGASAHAWIRTDWKQSKPPEILKPEFQISGPLHKCFSAQEQSGSQPNQHGRSIDRLCCLSNARGKSKAGTFFLDHDGFRRKSYCNFESRTVISYMFLTPRRPPINKSTTVVVQAMCADGEDS